jgi:hypothetical protein
MVQEPPGLREKLDPNGDAQVSCSIKFERPLKSLGAPKEPLLTFHPNVRPLRVAAQGSLFVSVIVCVVGIEPSI